MEKGLTSLKDFFIGDRAFEIPVYQRNYSWEEKQCDDLWNDLFYLKPGKKHYFGTILIKRANKTKEQGLKSFEIFELIDGQQRISTILMVLREIITQIGSLDDPEFREGLEKLEEDYLKYGHVYKLDLMGEDKEFYRDYIINNKDFPAQILTPSRKRLKDAKTFFKNKFESIKEDKETNEFKKFLMEHKKKIDDMDIIRYEVENDADAVLIFETVNDRGKLLTNLEKTKSFLMHAVYLSETDNLDDSLEKINNSFTEIFRWFEDIKTTERGKNLREDDVQRYHFTIYEKMPKKMKTSSYNHIDFIKDKIKNLYRTNEIQSLKYALEYTEDLRSAFFALQEIITYSEKDLIGKYLEKIFALDRVANFYPLLIAAWIKYRNKIYSETEIQHLLKIIEVASFRIYAIGKRKSNTGESLLHTMAYDVHINDISFQELEHRLLFNLIHNYQDDRNFRNNLISENFYNRVGKADIKYLLYEYGSSICEQLLDYDLNSILTPDFQVEHIMPNNPSKLGLNPEELQQHEQSKDQAGNLTIAHKDWNAHWGNRPFKEKKDEYKKSGIMIQYCLSEFEEWGTEQIKGRENRIISYALQRWAIPSSDDLQLTF